MLNRMKNGIKRSGLWRRYWDYRRIGLRIRALNWLVHRVIYGQRGLKFSVHFASRVIRPDRVKLGKNVVSIGLKGGLYIQAVNGVEIGDDTIIAPGVKIISANHDLEDYGKHFSCEPVRIGRRCWLGVNAIILPGVQLGDEVIVGAGAVVTKSFPARSVIAGVPAKLLRQWDPSEPASGGKPPTPEA